MPLDKTAIPVSLGMGMDTRTDPKQLQGKVVLLQNGLILGKKIVKRNGYTSLSQSILNGGSVSQGVGVAAYKNELALLDGSNLYSRSSATSNWANKGTLATTSVQSTSVVRSSTVQSAPDSAINGNLQLFAWADTANSGSVRYSVIDTSSGQTLVNNQQLTSNAAYPRVAAIGSIFVVFYSDSATFGSIYYKVVSTATPTTLGTQQTLASDLDPSIFVYDVSTINGVAYIAYSQNTGTQKIALYSLNSSLVKSSQFLVTATGKKITVFGDASFNVWVAYSTDTSIKAFVVNSALSSFVLSATTVDAGTDNSVQNITGAVIGTTAKIFYELGFTTTFYAPYQQNLWSNTLTLVGVAGSSSILVRGLGLSSKAFVFSSQSYVLTTFATTLQSTYFLINGSGAVICKISPNLAGGTSPGYVASVNAASSNVYQIATLQKDLIIDFENLSTGRSGTTNAYTPTGVQSAQITFSTQAQPKLTIASNLHIGGGLMWIYDGANVVEHNFHMYPEGMGVTTNATSGGGIGIGTSTATTNQVQYVALYEWMDNQGQIHRSCTSLPLTVQLPVISAATFTGTATINSKTITSVPSTVNLAVGQVIADQTNTGTFPAGTYITAIVTNSSVVVSQPALATHAGDTFNTKDLGKITLLIPTLRLTSKSNVSIVIYRTTNNGSVFYRISNPISPLSNNTGADSVTYQDTTPDSQIVGNEQLYTTGGEVPNGAAPAISACCSYKNRFIYFPSENTSQFGYSKQVIPGTPVEFSPLLFLQNVDAQGGALTCGAQMDDKLILFKRDRIFVTAGDGPTPAGTNNDFLEPQIVSTDTGCNNPASVVLTPLGLMYQSPKGIYLLDRSLSNTYIGADVEAYNSQSVTSSQLLTSIQQVRFTLSSGVTLVFDYLVGQWSVFTNYSAVDSTISNGVFTFVNSSGVVNQESVGTYTDNGAFIQLSLTTSWLNLAGIQSLGRIWHVEILGDYKSPHTLQTNIGYDYQSTFSQMASIAIPSTPSTPYQFRVHIQQQKCDAIQLQIQDSQSSGFGEGLSLSGITFYAGLKKGLKKLAASESFG